MLKYRYKPGFKLNGSLIKLIHEDTLTEYRAWYISKLCHKRLSTHKV